MRYKPGLLLLLVMLFALPAQAGHLFTQNIVNTPVNLQSGKGIQITQSTFEGGGSAGAVSLDFIANDSSLGWSAGDILKITIAGYNQTFSYDAPMTGAIQGSTYLYVNDPALVAAALDLDETSPFNWTIQSIAGEFTFAGYRIYTGNETLDGTGAGLINQSQVVDANNLGGGVFEPVATRISSPTAVVLDALNGQVGGNMGAIITAMAALPTAQRTAAIKKVSPETGMAAAQASNQAVTAVLDTVQVRLNGLRTGNIPNPNLAYQHDEDYTGLSSGDQPLNHNYWIKGFGGKSNQDDKKDFAGFESDIYGLSLGADTSLDNNWIVGAAFAYARTNVRMDDFREGDGADINTYQLTAYTSKDYGRWYIEGMLSYALQGYDTNRNTGVSGIADADFSGDQYALRLVSGLPIKTNYYDVTVTPYIGFEANHISQNSYTEKGAGAFSLNVDNQDTDRVRALAGSEFKMETQLSNDLIIRPSLRVGWRHEFKTDGLDSTTAFTGGGGNFVTEGQAINRNIYTLGTGVEFEQNETTTIAVNLDAETASGYTGYFGQVIGTFRF